MPHSNPNPDPTPISASANNSLATIQAIARDKEEIYGQLYLLANEAGKTLLTFDFGYQRPQKSALELRPTIGGVPVNLAGYQVVCKGICYVAGQLQEIAAYRK